jgi:hypothetical protein
MLSRILQDVHRKTRAPRVIEKGNGTGREREKEIGRDREKERDRDR